MTRAFQDDWTVGLLVKLGWLCPTSEASGTSFGHLFEPASVVARRGSATTPDVSLTVTVVSANHTSTIVIMVGEIALVTIQGFPIRTPPRCE